VWCSLCDPTFSRFSRTPTCDRQTDRHRHMASTADAQHRAVKITGIRLLSQLPVEVEWYTFLQHNVEYKNYKSRSITHTHTHTCLTALFLGLPGWVSTRKVKPIWILLKQETVSDSGIGWAICKSASRSRQITMPVLHHSNLTKYTNRVIYNKTK